MEQVRPLLLPAFDKLLTISQRDVIDGAVELGLRMLRVALELNHVPSIDAVCLKLGVRNTAEGHAIIFASACATQPELYLEFYYPSLTGDALVYCFESGKMRLSDPIAQSFDLVAMHLARRALAAEAEALTMEEVAALAEALTELPAKHRGASSNMKGHGGACACRGAGSKARQ